ncbi:unnamed protein product [Rhizoctonia solani]|uniref:Uncharacterized protein n=1 Tax=Rhizoctonia solani TaxID=456999 RepID=A0A8H3CDU0_9AGAM|nr:unnamed protein product [Rhizoctonia solani]
MSDYIQQDEVTIFATNHSGPLAKSLAGFRSLTGIGTDPVAFMFTNKYDAMVWPDDKKPMTLKGAAQDRVSAQMFLDQFTPGIRVVVSKSGNLDARREDIEDGIKEVVHSCPPLMVAYFQGHGEEGCDKLRYITGDRKGDGTLEGFTAERLLEMFSKLSTRTVSIVITDFCYSGNIYRLQYCLYLSPDGKSYLWYETDEWFKDNQAGWKHRFHVAGSLEWEQVYETEKRGGYLTNSLAKLEAGSTTVPQFLLGIRQGVGSHLEDGRARASQPLPRDTTQQPQIYCTHKLPLDDSEIFSRIYLGTAEPFNSISS